MLHVAETIVLVLREMVHIDFVGLECRLRLLFGDTRLDFWPLVIKEKFKAKFICSFVLFYAKGEAKTWLVFIVSISGLRSVLVDRLHIGKGFEIEKLS